MVGLVPTSKNSTSVALWGYHMQLPLCYCISQCFQGWLELAVHHNFKCGYSCSADACLWPCDMINKLLWPAVVPFVHSGFEQVFPGKAKLPRPRQTVRILVGEPLGFGDLTAGAQQHGWSEETLQSAIAARIGRTLCELKAQLDGLPMSEVMSSKFELDPLALRPLIGEHILHKGSLPFSM